MTTETGNFVAGEWTDTETGETFEVRDPADATTVVGRYQASSATDANVAIEEAKAATEDWADTPGPERGAILERTSEILASRKEEATELLVTEEGKARAEASGEVQRAIDIFAYYGGKARDLGGTVKAASDRRSELSTRREPLGVVGLLTPWNYPIAIPTWKMAPALATGNTLVLKPASQAPGVAGLLFECLAEAGLPPGVANLVTGSGTTVGSAIVEHEAVEALSFTGSTAVGTTIAQSAAEDLKRVQCEMGGKNPTVVMPSADVEQAASIVGAGAFGTTGQSCTATSRAIVHEEVYDEFVAAIAEHAESLAVGPGLDDPDVGPQVSQSELDTTLEYVDVAQTEGATLVTGGERLTGERYDDGYFVSPTVFADVDNDSRLAQEEVFGPVLAVIPVQSFEEALATANDVDYGLSASVVTQDLTEANEFLDDIEAGVAKVNEKTTGLELHVPFGGYKQSSTNTFREQGDAALDFFTQTKTVYRNY